MEEINVIYKRSDDTYAVMSDEREISQKMRNVEFMGFDANDDNLLWCQ